MQSSQLLNHCKSKSCRSGPKVSSVDSDTGYRLCPLCGFTGPSRTFSNHVRWEHPQTYHKVGASLENSKQHLHQARSLIKTHANQYTKAKRLGLPSPKNPKFGKVLGRGTPHTEETKQKIREARIQALSSGVVLSGGRCKVTTFLGNNCGEIKVWGSWEKRFASWLDMFGIPFERGKMVLYSSGGKVRRYFPDFYIPSHFLTVEVKGYETTLDREKWSQFAGKLVVVKGYQIANLERLTFSDLFACETYCAGTRIK